MIRFDSLIVSEDTMCKYLKKILVLALFLVVGMSYCFIQNSKKDNLKILGYKNFISWMQFPVTKLSTVFSGKIKEISDYVLVVDAGMPACFANYLYIKPLSPISDSIKDDIASGIEYFKLKNYGFTLVFEDHHISEEMETLLTEKLGYPWRETNMELAIVVVDFLQLGENSLSMMDTQLVQVKTHDEMNELNMLMGSAFFPDGGFKKEDSAYFNTIFKNSDLTGPYRFYFIVYKNKRVGTAILYFDEKMPDIAGVYGLAITPKFQRCGICTQALLQLVIEAREAGCKKLIGQPSKGTMGVMKKIGKLYSNLEILQVGKLHNVYSLIINKIPLN